MQIKLIMFILTLLIFYINIYADSINKNFDLEEWKTRSVSQPKKACADCNFFIVFPLKNNKNSQSVWDNDIQIYKYNNIQMLQNNATENMYKLIFIQTDIKKAYQEIIKHKASMSCMYCGDLDMVAKVLPKYEKIIKFNNVTYYFTPMQDSYKIEIKDNVCGIVDTLLFMQDGNGSVLWVNSILNCPKQQNK